MRILKPQRLGILQRVVEHERRHTLVVSVLVYAPLAAPRKLSSEQAMWKELGPLVAGGVIDESYPKPRGEALVTASAFAPGGKPAGAVMARLSILRDDKPLLDKQLAAIGDRYWKGNKPTDPIPFTSMPIDWAHAFGGESHAQNPLGKGVAPIAGEHGELHPLPNIEDPKRLVAARGDRPAPAGFSALDLTWPQRFAKVGKEYGGDWLEKRFPGPARDFDAHFYNAAPADQQIEGFWNGSEDFVLEGMHPERPKLEGKLEPLVVRAFVTQGESFRPLATRLDTLHFFPHLERMVLVYRGTLAVAADDADDVEHLMVAAEDPAHPKPLEHYRGVLALRLDKEKGAIAALKDEDLMPPRDAGWQSRIDLGELGEAAKLEHRALDKAARGRARRLAEAEAHLTDAGFDVGDAFAEPDLPPLPDPYDADALMETAAYLRERAEQAKAEAEEKKAEMEARTRAAFAEAGYDWDAERERAARIERRQFSADEHLIMLHDMARIAHDGGKPLVELERDLTDPRFEQMLRELEREVRQSQLRFAHLLPAAGLPDEERRQLLRVQVSAAKDAGVALSGRNLAGADLHDLDLRDMDLAGALLEGADLAGADLSGAKLVEAVLARAKLDGTRLCGADLTRANLGAATLNGTDLSGALLDETVMMSTIFDGAVLAGARLVRATFFEAEFREADFSHVEAEKPIFMRADLRRVSFIGARMQQACFLEVDARGVDFTGADLPRAVFAKVQGEGATFTGANLAGAAFVYESSFANSVLSNANLKGANAHKVSFAGSRFDEAVLEGANLGACDLRGCNLRRSVARQALFMRADLGGANLRGADLLGAVLQKASLVGADLTGANLSRADLSLVRVDGATRVDRALMLDTRVEPKA